MKGKWPSHLPLLGLEPRLALLFPVVDAQFLQQDVAPVIARAVPATYTYKSIIVNQSSIKAQKPHTHLPALLQKLPQRRRRRPPAHRRAVPAAAMKLHPGSPLLRASLELLHLGRHAGFVPFFIAAGGIGDGGFVGEEF